jgi:hypothetical protein
MKISWRVALVPVLFIGVLFSPEFLQAATPPSQIEKLLAPCQYRRAN